MNQHLVELLESQLKKDPTSRVFLRLAEEHRKAERYGEAIGVCQMGLKNHPNYLPGLLCLGRCQVASGLFMEAKHTLGRAAELDPGNLPVLLSMLETFEGLGDEEGQRETLNKLSLLDPSEEIAQKLSKLNSQPVVDLDDEAEVPEVEEESVEVLPPQKDPENSEIFEDYHNSPFSSHRNAPVASEPKAVDEDADLFLSDLSEDNSQDQGDLFQSEILADIYKQQGHLEEARDMLQKIPEKNTELIDQLDQMDHILQRETKSAKKIRILSNWLRMIKEY